MANRNTHMAVGGLACFIGYVIYKMYRNEELDIFESAVAVFIGIVGGMAPDIIEPALHPNHRKFFHSITFIIGSAYARDVLNKCDQVPEEIKRVFDCFGVGYASHLALDAQTPKGLPII